MRKSGTSPENFIQHKEELQVRITLSGVLVLGGFQSVVVEENDAVRLIEHFSEELLTSLAAILSTVSLGKR